MCPPDEQHLDCVQVEIFYKEVVGREQDTTNRTKYSTLGKSLTFKLHCTERPTSVIKLGLELMFAKCVSHLFAKTFVYHYSKFWCAKLSETKFCAHPNQGSSWIRKSLDRVTLMTIG